jgi:hypothetical protein
VTGKSGNILKQLTSYILLVSVAIYLMACNSTLEFVPDPPPNTGPFVISGHLINGTTKKPYNVGERIYLYIDWMDWSTVHHSERLGAATIQQDGSFELEYPYHKQTAYTTTTFSLSSGAFETYSVPRNQNVEDTFYYATQSTVKLFVEAPQKSNSDTLYLAIPTIANKHPIFKTVNLPYSGFIDEYRMYTNAAIYYGVNFPLEPRYDTTSSGFRGSDLHKIKSQKTYAKGDPFIDSAVIKLP